MAVAGAAGVHFVGVFQQAEYRGGAARDVFAFDRVEQGFSGDDGGDSGNDDFAVHVFLAVEPGSGRGNCGGTEDAAAEERGDDGRAALCGDRRERGDAAFECGDVLHYFVDGGNAVCGGKTRYSNGGGRSGGAASAGRQSGGNAASGGIDRDGISGGADFDGVERLCRGGGVRLGA